MNASLTGVAGGFLGFAPCAVQSWLSIVSEGESEYDAWVFVVLYVFTGLYLATIVISIVPVWWRSLPLGCMALASTVPALVLAGEPVLFALAVLVIVLISIATVTSASALDRTV